MWQQTSRVGFFSLLHGAGTSFLKWSLILLCLICFSLPSTLAFSVCFWKHKYTELRNFSCSGKISSNGSHMHCVVISTLPALNYHTLVVIFHDVDRFNFLRSISFGWMPANLTHWLPGLFQKILSLPRLLYDVLLRVNLKIKNRTMIYSPRWHACWRYIRTSSRREIN